MAKGKYKDWITKEGLMLIEGWARDGLTDEQIADNIGIRRETLYDWKKKYPNISNALKNGKEVVDRAVENALYKKATGYTEKVKKAKVLNNGKIVNYTEEIYFSPDTTAIAIWLNNRKPDDWKRNRGKEELEREKLEFIKSADGENIDALNKLDDILRGLGGVMSDN